MVDHQSKPRSLILAANQRVESILLYLKCPLSELPDGPDVQDDAMRRAG